MKIDRLDKEMGNLLISVSMLHTNLTEPYIAYFINTCNLKVKVSHCLIAVEAVGVREAYLSWVQQLKSGAHPSSFAALSFPDS